MPPHKSHTLCDGIYLSKSEAEKLTNWRLKWEERKPIGVRFIPTDQALARILVDKVFDRTDDNIVLSFFISINVYDHEPSSLSNFAHEFGEGKSYFFTKRRKKHENSKKNMERTVSGYGSWVINGSAPTIEIMDIENLSVKKNSLVFYTTIPKGKTKTPWLMKEYVLEKSDDVLCVIYYGKQRQSYENGTRSESFDEGRQGPSSMPISGLGSPQVFNNSIAASSFLPPISIQNDPKPCRLQDPSVTFTEHDNHGNWHFPISTSTPHEISGNISFLPEPVSASSSQLIQDSVPSLDSFTSNSQLIQDSVPSLDSFTSNSQQLDVMDYQTTSYENLSDDVLCFICYGKQRQSYENGTSSESFDEGREVPSSMPISGLGSPQAFNNIIASSSFRPPISIQNDPKPCRLQDPSVAFAEHDNHGNWHFPISTSTPHEISGNISFILEPVSETSSQLIQDSVPSLDSFASNSQQPDVMDYQTQPVPYENPEPIVSSPFDTIQLYQNGILNNNPSMDPDGPILSPEPSLNFTDDGSFDFVGSHNMINYFSLFSV